MKYFAYLVATILALAATAMAGPLQREQVAADAKWLLHLDVDKLRSTTVGDSFVKEVNDKVLAEQKAKLNRDADFDLDLSKLKSVTAYGDYGGSNNVILLKGDFDVGKLLETALGQVAKQKGLPSWPFEKSVRDGIVTYTFPDHVSIWIRPDKTTIFSKSSEATEKANAVLSGKTASLASSGAFADFPKVQKTFFFFGAAEGFNSSRELNAEAGGKNNPKAKILNLTDSGRIVIGQDADQIFLNVSLKAKTADVVTQMQQVVQGMIALASLTQSENEDFQQLANSAKVSAAGNIVSLSLNYPAEKALLMLNKQLERRDHEREPSHDTNTPSKINEK
jgi:hypothetical protein